MRKNFFRSMVFIFVIYLCLATFCTSAWSSGEKKYALKFASEYFPKHPSIEGFFMPWVKEIKEMTNSRLEIQYFPPGALTPQKEHYAATVSGAVDMAFSPQAFTPGKFPLAMVLGLPLLFDSAEAGSLASMDLYKQFPEWRNEYSEYKFLWTHASALFELHTTKKLVKSLEDFKGMKVIVWLPPARVMAKALGANPVEFMPNDTYLALERGMADGVLCPLAPIRAKKISDAAKYHTMLGLFLNPFWGAMNQKKFNSLPPDLRKIMEDRTGVEMARGFGRTLDEGADRDEIQFKKEGHKFYYLPPEEKKRWVGKVKGIHNKWLKDTEAKGYKNAKKIYDAALSLAEKYSKK